MDSTADPSPPPHHRNPPPSMMILENNNDDVLLRIMEYLGPRHVVIGLGSTCRDLCRLSRCDSLWRAFWKHRCCPLPPRFPRRPSSSSSHQLLPGKEDDKSRNYHRGCDDDDDDDDVDGIDPHGAALVFRRVMCEFDRFGGGGDVVANHPSSSSASSSSSSSSSLYEAYVRVHTMMKRRNLRVEATVVGAGEGRGGGDDDGDGRIITSCGNDDNDNTDNSVDFEISTNLIAPRCTQTWPGRLSVRRAMTGYDGMLAVEDDDGDNANHDDYDGRGGGGRRRIGGYAITCLNPAEAWCDDPRCDAARCGGSRGCLRRYRFMPSPPAMFGGCTSREYELPLSFVRCDWCQVSFCNKHGGGGGYGSNDYYDIRWTQRGVDGDGDYGARGTRSWYECDECNLSSCPDCVSQVFPSYFPNDDGCRVVTAGKVCRRNVCAACVWVVGRKKQHDGSIAMVENVPGGDYGHIRRESTSYDVVTTRGVDSYGKEEWEECETCCSRCLRHVEFRWRELARVQESFRGFMP